jgi:hypothetical protein
VLWRLEGRVRAYDSGLPAERLWSPSVGEWRAQRGDEVLHPKRAARLLEPWRERRFTFDAFARFLDRLGADPDVATLPLRELHATRDAERVLVGIRHDVDVSLDRALELGRIEHGRGVRSTFFVLHTAPYWRRPDLVDRLLELQELGHEVGWHSDLVTIEVTEHVDARAYLFEELERLRRAGVDIRGVAPHGSYWAHALGYSNADFFPELEESVTTEVLVDALSRRVPTGTLAEFGFDYEAYHVDHDVYVSDSLFDRAGNRWHPMLFDTRSLVSGQRAVVLIHPCHWDRSVPAKYARLLARGVRLLSRHADQARRRTPS